MYGIYSFSVSISDASFACNILLVALRFDVHKGDPVFLFVETPVIIVSTFIIVVIFRCDLLTSR